MSRWYTKVTADPNDLSPLIDAIEHFDQELVAAKADVKIKGNIERLQQELPGIVEHRFNQLQEVEAILKYLDIKLDRIRGSRFRHYLEHYNRALSSRDVERYVDSDDEVQEIALLVNQFAMVRNRYLGIMKGLDQKSFALSNITRLRVAGMEDSDLR